MYIRQAIIVLLALNFKFLLDLGVSDCGNDVSQQRLRWRNRWIRSLRVTGGVSVLLTSINTQRHLEHVSQRTHNHHVFRVPSTQVQGSDFRCLRDADRKRHLLPSAIHPTDRFPSQDWETGIYEGIKPLLDRVDPKLANNKRDALFAYFSVEDDLQARYPTMLYADILARAHAELATRTTNKPQPPDTVSTYTTTTEMSGGALDTTTSVGTSAQAGEIDPAQAEHVAFGKSIPTWKPFPDTIPALAYLSTKYKLAVLSNVDRASFKGTQAVLETSLPEHRFTFDAVYTAQDIGSYKPNPANFEYALEKLKEEFGVEKEEVLVVAASLTHDHVPANALGLAGVFIDRGATSLNADPSVATYNAKFPTLGAFAEEVKRLAGDS